MGDNPARHHIGAVADARSHVADRSGRDAELREIFEPGNTGGVPPDPGVIEDRRSNAELRRDIGGIDSSMRAIDDNGAFGFGTDAGDAVDSCDRRGHGRHGSVSRIRK